MLDIGCVPSRITGDLPDGVGLDVAFGKLGYLKRHRGRLVRNAASRVVIVSWG